MMISEGRIEPVCSMQYAGGRQGKFSCAEVSACRVRAFCLLLTLLMVFTQPSISQVNVSGIFDAEFRKGGDGSSVERNELVNSNPHFAAQRLQLFLDADLGEDVSFTAKLQNNEIFAARLKDIELQLAYVTLHDIAGLDLNLSVGRILTPFGLFAKRQLSPDNPLIGFPLFFQYSVRVSPTLGYHPGLVPGDPYGGLSTMYKGGYLTGAQVYGSLGSIPVSFDVAVTNAPMSLFNSEVNLTESLSYQGRLGFYPWLFLELGVSANYGPFMDETLGGFLGNPLLLQDSAGIDPSEHLQQTIGFDLTVDWMYYRLTAEVISNSWNAPFVNTFVYPYVIRAGTGNIKLANTEFLIDLRVDVPWVIGLFVAGRFNLLEFDTIDDPLNPGTTIRWDNTVRRYGVGVGYKLTRRVILKAAYEWMDIHVDPKPYLNRWGAQLSTSF